MKALSCLVPHRPRWMLSALFGLGVVLLVATWMVVYWAESQFTESHLVGYYCCATEQDLPAPGTLERSLSDFFRTSPGMHLPAVVFVAANVCFFALSLRRGRGHYWWLPFLFVALNVLYLWLDFELLAVSWLISNRLVGPQTSAYKGYERTWYGILLHLMLWGVFFIALSGVLRKLLPKLRSIRESNSS